MFMVNFKMWGFTLFACRVLICMIIYTISVIIALCIRLPVYMANMFWNLDFLGWVEIFSHWKLRKKVVLMSFKSLTICMFSALLFSSVILEMSDNWKEIIRFLIVKTGYTELSNSYSCASDSLGKYKMLRADFCAPPPFAFTTRCVLEELVFIPRIN